MYCQIPGEGGKGVIGLPEGCSPVPGELPGQL